MGRPCARKNEKGVTHCSGFKIVSASGNVKVNGRGVVRKGDRSSVHLKPAPRKCRPHVSKVAKGSRSVKVNGRSVARRFDKMSGCTAIASGSSNVLVGG